MAPAAADAAGGPRGVADEVQTIQPGVQARVRRGARRRRSLLLRRRRDPGTGRRGRRRCTQGNARGRVERRGRRLHELGLRCGVVGRRGRFSRAFLGIGRETAPARVPLNLGPPRGRAQRPQRVPRHSSRSSRLDVLVWRDENVVGEGTVGEGIGEGIRKRGGEFRFAKRRRGRREAVVVAF